MINNKRSQEISLIKRAINLRKYKYNIPLKHLTSDVFNGDFIVRNDLGEIIARIPKGQWVCPEWM